VRGTTVAVLVGLVGLVGLGCKTDSGHTLAVLACTQACSAGLALAIDACDGNGNDGVQPPSPPTTLYTACVGNATLARLGCPLACEEIPRRGSTDEP